MMSGTRCDDKTASRPIVPRDPAWNNITTHQASAAKPGDGARERAIGASEREVQEAGDSERASEETWEGGKGEGGREERKAAEGEGGWGGCVGAAAIATPAAAFIDTPYCCYQSLARVGSQHPSLGAK